MSKLEKFKRRMIRSVAMLMFHEKKPENELWEIMKTETGSNCKVLWDRMRALTLKKLKKLLEAEDRPSSIPKFAQMSDTDWLLFDLIVTHEDEDVIGIDEFYQKSSCNKALSDLMSVVEKFEIQSKRAEELAEAWTAATIYYNSAGHGVSPMLLQRRWYQLKHCTRCRFYNFWFGYRGNAKYWDSIQHMIPNDLQRAVVTKYPEVITLPSKSWEELIEARLVILPEEFEINRNKPKSLIPRLEDTPDLLLLEPNIETIDLEEYISDEENGERNVKNLHESPPVIKIKTEPEDAISDTEYDEINVDKTNISMEVMCSLVHEESLIDLNDTNAEINNEINTENVENKAPDTKFIEEEVIEELQQESSVVSELQQECMEVQEIIPDDTLKIQQAVSNIEIEDYQQSITEEAFQDGVPKITSVFGNVDITNEALIKILTQNSEELNINELVTADRNNEKDSERITLNDISNTDNVIEATDAKEKIYNNEVLTEDLCSIENVPVEMNNDTVETIPSCFGGIRNYFNFMEEGIELVDDGIEYVEDDELQKNPVTQSQPKSNTEENEDFSEPDEAKFDLKLLMQTVVFTTKLDDMKIFKNKPFDSINGKSLMESVTIESKPVSNKSLNIPNSTNISESIDSDNEVKEIDTKRIDLSSNLLNTPKYRNYNPILLCKNPDFNTRLKRLTVSFLSSSRNRSLLKACKPMTIDMSKAFESKLVNGTLYLKKSELPVNATNSDSENTTASMIPSAKSVQSLIENTSLQSVPSVSKRFDNLNNKTPPVIPPMSIQNFIDNKILHSLPPELNNIDELTEPSTSAVDSTLAERNKTVNLPDMQKVRLINQRLLTAEVTPFQVHNSSAQNINISGRIIDQRNHTNISTQENNLSNSVVEFNPNPHMLLSLNHDVYSQKTKDFSVNKTINRNSILAINHQVIIEGLPQSNLNNENQMHTDNTNVLNTSGNINSVQADKQKKNKKKVVQSIPWYSKTAQSNVYSVKESAPLITRDTLMKMLSHIDGSWDITIPQKRRVVEIQQNKNTNTRRTGKKANIDRNKMSTEMELTSNVTNFIDNSELINDVTNFIDKVVPINNVSNVDETKESNNLKGKRLKPKISIMYIAPKKSRRQKNCCWARSQLRRKNPNLISQSNHKCEVGNCTCCCKYKLKILRCQIQNNAQNASKNECESIESVVQQTRELIAVKVPAKKIPTKSVAVQTQIDTVDLSDDSCDNQNTEITKSYCSNYIKDTSADNTEVIGKYRSSENVDCCWSRAQLRQKNIKVIYSEFKHKCEVGNCTCCCKNELKDLREQIQDISETVSKNDCEETESVVQQTPELISLKDTADKLLTETVTVEKSIDTVDLSDDSCDNETTDIIQYCGNEVKDTPIDNIETIAVSSVDINDQVRENYERTDEGKEISIAIDNITQSEIGVQELVLPLTPIVSSRNIQVLQSGNTIQISPNNTSSISSLGPISKHNLPQCSKTVSPMAGVRCSQTKPSQENRKLSQLHMKNLKEKVLILNRRHILNKNKENPIYLGKNKILVTTAKIPGRVTDIKETSNSFDGLLYETPLPKGVQLTVMPDGDLTCNLLPGAEVTTHDLSVIPSIMDKVQNYFKGMGLIVQHDNNAPKIIMSGPEVLNLDENELTSLKTCSSNNSPDVVSKYFENKNDSTNPEISSENPIKFDNTNSACEEKNAERSTSDQQNVSENNECRQPPVENIIDTSEPKTNIESSEEGKTDKDTASTNRKTLLSDLMEMSGISAEDVTPTSLGKGQIIEECTVRSGNGISYAGSPINIPDCTSQISGLEQLNTITSYSDLKYACENNGSFFKLDFKTGVIVPITVSMKKTAPVNSNQKVIIDLTDEKDNREEQIYNVVPNKNSNNDVIAIKPLFKPLHYQGVSKNQLNLQKKKSLLNILRFKKNDGRMKQLTPLFRFISERNNTNSDSVNSNHVVDHLSIDSSDDETPQAKRANLSESSDDEPLISLAKRKKKNESKENEVEVQNKITIAKRIETTNRNNENEDDVVENIDENEEYLELENLETAKDISEKNEDPYNPTMISFLSDHSDDDGDCILGF